VREIAELAVRRSRRTALISEIPRWALPAAWRVIRPFDLNVAGLILVMAAPAARTPARRLRRRPGGPQVSAPNRHQTHVLRFADVWSGRDFVDAGVRQA